MTDYEAMVLESRLDPSALLILGDYLEEKGDAMLLKVGEKYLVMTLTNYWTGLVVESTPGRTVFKNPAWVADTGRLSEALKTGNLTEVEPLPDGESLILNTQHISAGIVWPHALPRKVK